MSTFYNQTLDFQVFEKDLKQIAENISRDPLKDMEEFSPEILQFFEDLLNAQNTSQLSKYSELILSEGMDLLYKSEKILSYMKNFLEDDSILSSKDMLVKNIRTRHLKTARRLL